VPDWLAAALIAFGVATVTTPAGVSGAVFLLPVQASVLGVPSPALTPTNLLYNVIATPGALARYARAGRLRSPLARAILLGALPGVVAGAAIRVELLPGRRPLLVAMAAVLLALGAWLASGRSPGAARPTRDAASPPRWISPLAALVGGVGGIAGIGGGSLLAPLLAAAGYPLVTLAPAALLATFATSVAGVLAFSVLAALHGGGDIAPDWRVGVALGVGGMLGGYAGAALQPRLSEQLLRRLLGAISLLLALGYAVDAWL
jgi:uncharacterized membrane protein YfcA